MKLGRLRARKSALVVAQADYDAGHVHVCLGSKKFAKTRHNLEAANLTEPQWRRKWEDARSFVSFPGESGKRGGNETLRVDERTGVMTLRLPNTLAHLANRPGCQYEFDAKVTFTRHSRDWFLRSQSRGSIEYRISENVDRERWYVDASFQSPGDSPSTAPELDDVLSNGVVGVDRNATHVDAWALDRTGNPLGQPLRLELELTGLSKGTRDARVRETLTLLSSYARDHGCRAIALEDLGWAEEMSVSRELFPRRFRETLSQFPTLAFKSRAQGMLPRAGAHVVMVNPAYTSVWGAAHWARPLGVDRHQAAALVIGRRALGLTARRQDGSAHASVNARASSKPGIQPDGHLQANVAPGLVGKARGRPSRRRPPSVSLPLVPDSPARKTVRRAKPPTQPTGG